MNDYDHNNDSRVDAGCRYDAAFYAVHCGPVPYDRFPPHWPGFFGVVADEGIRGFQPRRVSDAGCAHGFLVEAFRDPDVEAAGRDISKFTVSQVCQDRCQFRSVGSIAADTRDGCDIVTCSAVLEHMPEAQPVAAINAMTAVTDRVVFSAAANEFAEKNHINGRPPVHWIRRFAEQGLAPNAAYDPGSIAPNTLVFQRGSKGRREADFMACAELVRQRPPRPERELAVRDLRSVTAAPERKVAEARKTWAAE